MSFREIAITIRANNRASEAFNRIAVDADSLAVKIKNLGNALIGIGAAGTSIVYIANQFGILNDQQTKVASSCMMLVSTMGMVMRTSTGAAIAQKLYSAATAFATIVQNTLNISFATFLALTGVGIAVIVAAAAAMYSFANSMNTATSSVQAYNYATTDMNTQNKSIVRSGDSASLTRQGVEG
jgi:hypothetical protein